jgi:predicted RNase H-like nuclease
MFGPAGRALFMRAAGTKPPAWVMGLDGCPAGWAGVMIDLNGTEPPRLRIFPRFKDALDAPERAQVIAVDMPIGSEDAASGSGRACEREVRAFIGPRRSSVFASPLRAALHADDYPAANAANRAGGAKGLSKQCWMITPKMREIDAVMTPSLEGCVHEVHPEASFTALSGAPMAWPKRMPEGRDERLRVLRRAGFDVSLIEPHAFPKSQAAPDDLVDAAVCALSAARIARGQALCFPQNPPRDGRGLRMAIFA